MARMPTYRNENVRRTILNEWDAWVKNHPGRGRSDAMLFFQHLQDKRFEVLWFRYPGEKQDLVHSWLLGSKRVDQ